MGIEILLALGTLLPEAHQPVTVNVTPQAVMVVSPGVPMQVIGGLSRVMIGRSTVIRYQLDGGHGKRIVCPLSDDGTTASCDDKHLMLGVATAKRLTLRVPYPGRKEFLTYKLK